MPKGKGSYKGTKVSSTSMVRPGSSKRKGSVRGVKTSSTTVTRKGK
jgi:hypothetical protein